MTVWNILHEHLARKCIFQGDFLLFALPGNRPLSALFCFGPFLPFSPLDSPMRHLGDPENAWKDTSPQKTQGSDLLNPHFSSPICLIEALAFYYRRSDSLSVVC